jgi:hypothetical protein
MTRMKLSELAPIERRVLAVKLQLWIGHEGSIDGAVVTQPDLVGGGPDGER